jgi:hypothetical protein
MMFTLPLIDCKSYETGKVNQEKRSRECSLDHLTSDTQVTGFSALHSTVLSSSTPMTMKESKGSSIGAPCRPRSGSEAEEQAKAFLIHVDENVDTTHVDTRNIIN